MQSLVSGMEWVDAASTELLETIRLRSTTIVFREGDRIYMALEPPGGLFHVTMGRLDLRYPDPELEHDLGHCFGPGWWVGDIAAISGHARRFDLYAGRDSQTMYLTRSDLLRICEDFPEMWRSLAMMASENMRVAVDTVASLRIKDPTSRVAACLGRLSHSGPGWINLIPISQIELAEICNISRRRVVSALKELDRRGWTTRHRMRIEIDPKKMTL